MLSKLLLRFNKRGSVWEVSERIKWSQVQKKRHHSLFSTCCRRNVNLPGLACYGCSCSSSLENGLHAQSSRGYSWFSGQAVGSQNAINEAEKLVGYPTTFNSWKYLFEEEPATFIGLARKIVGSGHIASNCS